MDNSFDNVKDSSVWVTSSKLSVINSSDNRLYVGIIREVKNVNNTNELRYLVEVRHKNDVVLTNCRMLRRHGGVFNYEDYVMQGYNFNAAGNNQNGIAAIAGDIVLVGQFAGLGREGVIIGSLTHPARGSFLDASKGPQYRAEFNGIETSINTDGEYTLTFKGQPTNLNVLANTPSQPISAPQYDTSVGTSFLKWDKTGSFTVSDNAKSDLQSLFIDKPNGEVTLLSGKISLVCKKSDQSVVWNMKTYETNATDHAKYTTPLMVLDSPKVRLGGENATDWLILGSAFRMQQMTMDTTLAAQFTALAAAFTTLAAASVGPLAPLVPGFTAGSAAATALGAAIQAFESAGAANNYLSAISKTK